RLGWVVESQRRQGVDDAEVTGNATVKGLYADDAYDDGCRNAVARFGERQRTGVRFLEGDSFPDAPALDEPRAITGPAAHGGGCGRQYESGDGLGVSGTLEQGGDFGRVEAAARHLGCEHPLGVRLRNLACGRPGRWFDGGARRRAGGRERYGNGGWRWGAVLQGTGDRMRKPRCGTRRCRGSRRGGRRGWFRTTAPKAEHGEQEGAGSASLQEAALRVHA